MELIEEQNILNWYPFKKEQKVLKISENCEELEKNISEKYDVITLIGISPKIRLESVIKQLENNLTEEGRFLIAVDNKFGIRFFAGNSENVLNKKFESLIGYSNEKERIETYTKKSLEDLLKKLGYKTRFYYPLPDYRKPNVIFSENQLPEYNSVDKYYPYYTENSDILFNEIDVFREILKTDKDMFTFFANSFLVEASKGQCDETYKYISFNNLRKEEYRLITKIADEYVEKQKVNEKADQHYQNIKDNIQILNENGIETVDYVENGKIRSKYIQQEYLLDNVLTEKLEQGKIEEFYEILDNYIKIISINTYKETDYSKTIFKQYGIEEENKKIIENMNFMKNGLWDMTFKNCFLIDNKFYFFDQEWNEANLPVEFILYRSIFYTISLRRFIQIEKLFERYNLMQYIELFEQLDNKLQGKIRDNNAWAFYNRNCKFNIDETKQEVINLNIRSNAQKAAYEELIQQNSELREKIKSQQSKITELQKQIDNTFVNKLKRILKLKNNN